MSQVLSAKRVNGSIILGSLEQPISPGTLVLQIRLQVAQARDVSIGEHRALLRNIQNIRICMGKKPIVSLTYENERISIKNSLPYLKCVLRLSCVVHGPIYGRFRGFYENGFLSI